MNILVVGDVVGKCGIEAIKKYVPDIKNKYNIDFTIINGENSADGMGITKSIYDDLCKNGADVVTMGNHTWGKKDIFSFIDNADKIIRPSNYAEGLPGKGFLIVEKNGKKIGVIELIGRVDMGGTYDNPFIEADEQIQKMKTKGVSIIIVEIHAEATAEKVAMGYYLREKATIVYGTHTHVQTADERVYDEGLGYITDIGMTGPLDSIIGMDRDAALKRFLTQIPERYSCADGRYILNAVVFSVNDNSGKVENIERICIK